MLYVVTGKDRQKTKAKVDELTEVLVKKAKSNSGRGSAAVVVEQVTVEAEELLNDSKLEQYLYNFGLFGEQYIVHCTDLLKDKTAAESFKNYFAAMAESPNLFIIREEDIDAATKKALTKIAEEIFEIAKPVAGGAGSGSAGDFNIFTMTDALGDKDRKKAWLTYVEARRLGNEPEQIFGTIWWFVKNMNLLSASVGQGVGKTNSTGLSPFVESKAKRALKNCGQVEVVKMSKCLVSIYHESRRGACDLAVELEKFVLGKY